MNEKMSKILMLVAGAIGVIAIFFLARIVIEGDDAITASADLQGSVISPFVTFSIIILVLTALVAVVFSAFTLFQQPEQLKKALMGIGVLGGLLLITYFVSPNSQVVDVTGKVLMEESSTSQVISAGISYAFLLGTIGLAFFLWDFVKSMIK
ncbi:MAG: hypothetical protein KGZ87_00010 [Bacteroidetes bacterium]|jgi:hypothetical protein|nr:hypothetical protein [Bacteroidota bacterium]